MKNDPLRPWCVSFECRWGAWKTQPFLWELRFAMRAEAESYMSRCRLPIPGVRSAPRLTYRGRIET